MLANRSEGIRLPDELAELDEPKRLLFEVATGAEACYATDRRWLVDSLSRDLRVACELHLPMASLADGLSVRLRVTYRLSATCKSVRERSIKRV